MADNIYNEEEVDAAMEQAAAQASGWTQRKAQFDVWHTHMKHLDSPNSLILFKYFDIFPFLVVFRLSSNLFCNFVYFLTIIPIETWHVFSLLLVKIFEEKIKILNFICWAIFNI